MYYGYIYIKQVYLFIYPIVKKVKYNFYQCKCPNKRFWQIRLLIVKKFILYTFSMLNCYKTKLYYQL